MCVVVWCAVHVSVCCVVVCGFWSLQVLLKGGMRGVNARGGESAQHVFFVGTAVVCRAEF